MRLSVDIMQESYRRNILTNILKVFLKQPNKLIFNYLALSPAFNLENHLCIYCPDKMLLLQVRVAIPCR